MIDAEQLKLLQRLAKERDEAALRQLARARAALHNAEQQLSLLSRYGTDYHDRLGDQVSSGMDGDTLRNYQAFMHNVGNAIDQQQGEVERRLAATRAAEQVWQESQRQLKSFETLATRGEQRARTASRRNDQREDDEFAARLTRAHQTSGA
jgi:flagellar FliJ protein